MGVWVVWVNALDCALHILTYEEGALATVVVPPLDQHFIVCGLGAYVPIDLRYIVIYPYFIYPKHYVGIEVIIVLCARGGAALLAVQSIR